MREQPRFKDIASLLARELTRDDTPDTRDLIDDLRVVRRRGYLTKSEFLTICRWKSPRSIRHAIKNSPARIKRQSAIALASRSERVRFEALTALDGVGAPTASAILTLTDPRRYGVIDIRVWQLLFELGSVSTKPGGVGIHVRGLASVPHGCCAPTRSGWASPSAVSSTRCSCITGDPNVDCFTRAAARDRRASACGAAIRRRPGSNRRARACSAATRGSALRRYRG